MTSIKEKEKKHLLHPGEVQVFAFGRGAGIIGKTGVWVIC